jgi:hypothetical protein
MAPGHGSATASGWLHLHSASPQSQSAARFFFRLVSSAKILEYSETPAQRSRWRTIRLEQITAVEAVGETGLQLVSAERGVRTLSCSSESTRGAWLSALRSCVVAEPKPRPPEIEVYPSAESRTCSLGDVSRYLRSSPGKSAVNSPSKASLASGSPRKSVAASPRKAGSSGARSPARRILLDSGSPGHPLSIGPSLAHSHGSLHAPSPKEGAEAADAVSGRVPSAPAPTTEHDPGHAQEPAEREAGRARERWVYAGPGSPSSSGSSLASALSPRASDISLPDARWWTLRAAAPPPPAALPPPAAARPDAHPQPSSMPDVAYHAAPKPSPDAPGGAVAGAAPERAAAEAAALRREVARLQALLAAREAEVLNPKPNSA